MARKVCRLRYLARRMTRCVGFGGLIASAVLMLLLQLETDNQLNEEQGEDEYRNVQVVNSIDCPTLHMVKRLRELKPSQREEIKVWASDVVSAGCCWCCLCSVTVSMWCRWISWTA